LRDKIRGSIGIGTALVIQGVEVPNSRSAKKRMRQAIRRNVRNRAARSALRTVIKRVSAVPADGADAAYRAAERLLDRAATKGLIHRNAAARSKRRLRRIVNSKS